jgi:hypothetical protein
VSAVTGSRVLVTDIGSALRGWLLLATPHSSLPVVLPLADQPYEPDTQSAAHMAVGAEGRALARRIDDLSDDQVVALVQQEGDDRHSGAELVDRLVRYWDRPRLLGVDWTVTGRDGTRAFVPNVRQERDWELTQGEEVMVASDGFPDVHCSVVERRGTGWLVDLNWDS